MAYIPINIEDAVKRECKRRRYSDRTIKTYNYCIGRFLRFTGKNLDKVSKKDVRLFLESLSEKERTGNTMNVYHMAIRFLFVDVLDRRIWIDIKYSRVPEKLPIVLNKKEISDLFDSINNSKHRLMIQLMYSAGLRVSELINLKIKDIEVENNYGWVRAGKGNKDRLFIVADSLKNELKNIIFSRDANEWLFTSRNRRNYSIRSLQKIVKIAGKSAGLEKRISCHTLRHSFATHLIEDGYSVSEVQALLGHKSPETTFIYLHTSSSCMIRIKSPLDNLQNQNSKI